MHRSRKVLRMLRKYLGRITRRIVGRGECEKNPYKSQNKCMCFCLRCRIEDLSQVGKTVMAFREGPGVFDWKINNTIEPVI
jgi:hypothetical protein